MYMNMEQVIVLLLLNGHQRHIRLLIMRMVALGLQQLKVILMQQVEQLIYLVQSQQELVILSRVGVCHLLQHLQVILQDKHGVEVMRLIILCMLYGKRFRLRQLLICLFLNKVVLTLVETNELGAVILVVTEFILDLHNVLMVVEKEPLMGHPLI